MNYRKLLIALVVVLPLMTGWQTAICQNVTQNPTNTQTIVQPPGTNFSVTGVLSLSWPDFRIDEETPFLVFRDSTQTDAWFMALLNEGNSTGNIQFFGNFTNGGVLLPAGDG